MINFKEQAYIIPSALILLSILILAGTLLYMVFVPAPSVTGLARGKAASLQEMTSEVKTAKIRAAQTRKQIAPLVWSGDPDAISGTLLEQLTAQARQEALSLSAFRPQRSQDVGGVTELPFTVQLSGAYAGVRDVMRTLDNPGSRVVLRSAQISSAATGSGVTATLGLTAYVLTDAPTAAVSPVVKPGKAARHA